MRDARLCRLHYLSQLPLSGYLMKRLMRYGGYAMIEHLVCDMLAKLESSVHLALCQEHCTVYLAAVVQVHKLSASANQIALLYCISHTSF